MTTPAPTALRILLKKYFKFILVLLIIASIFKY
ncbi:MULTISPECIES: hypothetical protein [Staphylococcus]